ncbi:GreA/GreB family elongation factor [Chlamydiifrater phoenicopteri]|uniref:GreA/GreB family elongation factor n=1 Tax=Chlamydiifrater phoenicopteri TaxID=2681469 RepID=UPI001BCE463D|nr:GreA/GreB family elongation factor [Chlamydiifrater phoenicopteri]
MDYLEKLQYFIDSDQPNEFVSLWEEFCFNDVVRGDELVGILKSIKGSSVAPIFGRIAETVLPLWEKLPKGKEKDEVFRLAVDLQTTNSKTFFELAVKFLSDRYSDYDHFSDALRFVGLREKGDFQYAISRFELIQHLRVGNFVFHSGGWGVGEVMESSFLQKKVCIEFEGVMSAKDVSFDSAIKNLSPLSKEHFLTRRFGDPDAFERFAKESPVEAIILMLRDLGPKTAKEIKDEFLDLIIPQEDWNRWWQGAKLKIKKDTRIAFPSNVRDAFFLTTEEISHLDVFKNSISKINPLDKLSKLTLVYNFLRDFPGEAKRELGRQFIREELNKLADDVDPAICIQALLLISDFFEENKSEEINEIASSYSDVSILVNNMGIASLQKNFLAYLRAGTAVWSEIFFNVLFSTSSQVIREYLFKELRSDSVGKEELKERLLSLVDRPTMFPDVFVWFFVKLCSKEDGIFLQGDKQIRQTFLEAALNFMYSVYSSQEHKDLGKKVHAFLVAKRYLVVREILSSASSNYLKEFLLLSTKCPQFSSADLGAFQGISEAISPELKKDKNEEEEIFWCTSESFSRAKEELSSLVGREMVDNAREIEEARALGDLRENSEYKFALERRSRIQERIRMLSEQVNKARILTKEDIFTDSVGIGCIVSLKNESGKKIEYTLLGAWDADPEKSILSMQSKFAQAMKGLKLNETFSFRGETFSILKIDSFLEKV